MNKARTYCTMKSRNNTRSKQGLPASSVVGTTPTKMTKLAILATILGVVSRLDNNILLLFHFHASALSPPSSFTSMSPPSAVAAAAACRGGANLFSNNGNVVVRRATQTQTEPNRPCPVYPLTIHLPYRPCPSPPCSTLIQLPEDADHGHDRNIITFPIENFLCIEIR